MLCLANAIAVVTANQADPDVLDKGALPNLVSGFVSVIVFLFFKAPWNTIHASMEVSMYQLVLIAMNVFAQNSTLGRTAKVCKDFNTTYC